MILYPTETIYALGANALDEGALQKLFALKSRDSAKSVSWLVRDMVDTAQYGVVSDTAYAIAARFLPGPLTLVVPAHPHVPAFATSPKGTIGFRISTDTVAREVVAAFMTEYQSPLTCTSANLSGYPTTSSPTAIIEQFGAAAANITEIYDDGVRSGSASTVVQVIGDEVIILREGAIPAADIINRSATWVDLSEVEYATANLNQ